MTLRTLVNRCLAAMHLMLSSKINLADSNGTLLDDVLDNGLYIVMCKHLESSCTPATSMSCKNPTSLATPHPSFFESGSTNINCITSITRNLLLFFPSFQGTVHAIRSELSANSQTLLCCRLRRENHRM